MLGPVSPTDRPDPNRDKQTPRWGWHCAEKESASARRPKVSAACASPSDRSLRRGSPGDVCTWREEHEALLR
jgi:hypothetical protein